MTQYLHITMSFKEDVDKDELFRKLNLALDWMHYLPDCWIVKTTSDAQKWFMRLKPLLGKNDYMFICRIDMSERQGWLPKWVWDWIEQSGVSP